jgi:hypothetical protein
MKERRSDTIDRLLAKRLGAYAMCAGAALGAAATAANAAVVSYTAPANDLINPDGLPDGLQDPDGIPGNGDEYYNAYDSYYTRYQRLPMTDPDGIPGNGDEYSMPTSFNPGDHGWYGYSPDVYATHDPPDANFTQYPLIMLQLDGTVSEVADLDPAGGPSQALWPEATTETALYFTREVDNWQTSGYTGAWEDDVTYVSVNNGKVSYQKLGAGVTIDSAFDFADGYQRGEGGLPADYDCSQHQVLNSYNGAKLFGDWYWAGDGYIAFELDGHYGWAHIDVADPRNDVVVYEYAYETVPGVPIVTGDMGSGKPGDFNNDTFVDAADIDMLADAIALGTYDATFDVNGDSFLDEQDLIDHIATLVERTGGVGTYRGDFNLDGFVDGTDLAIFKASFGLSGLGYAAGNANTDDFVDGTDLAIFKATFGLSGTPGAPNPDPVPEPATVALLALGATGLAARRRRK